MKTLYFEGAGWFEADTSKATDMKNCRVRTAFTNNKGERIYLEITAREVTKYITDRAKHLKYAGFVDSCFYITGGDNDVNENQIRNEKPFEYCCDNVLQLVNSLGCDFDAVATLPDLAGYRVFADGGKYNYGDEFQYDEERTTRAEEIYRYFYELEKSEGKQYPNLSLWVDESDPELLHLLRHHNGYNKHWTIRNVPDWKSNIIETELGEYGC